VIQVESWLCDTRRLRQRGIFIANRHHLPRARLGWRVSDGGGRLHKACFDPAGFHFVPADIGQYVPVDLDTGGKVLSALMGNSRYIMLLM